MASSNQPLVAPERKPDVEQTSAARNERPHLGEKEPKFVIKVSSSIPG